jgi:hypothetical protein
LIYSDGERFGKIAEKNRDHVSRRIEGPGRFHGRDFAGYPVAFGEVRGKNATEAILPPHKRPRHVSNQ